MFITIRNCIILQLTVDLKNIYEYIHRYAGSTWAQEMVWLIGHDLDYEGAKSLQQVTY